MLLTSSWNKIGLCLFWKQKKPEIKGQIAPGFPAQKLINNILKIWYKNSALFEIPEEIKKDTAWLPVKGALFYQIFHGIIPLGA